ncbi:efflux RND transporter permease subunit [Chungangia koreensis]|uniref:Efflux RND transporter permease subunit n=1 Tax=Chungangia koreensis TaxID=752657 RepID=A0ABV8X1Q0_9LACT
MKGLVNFVLKNKMAVWLLTIIITVSGIYSGTRMKMESIPDISIPYLIVMGVYPGATPEQVMEDVSIPLEKAVEGLEDVKAVYSTSSSNISQLQIEYEYGVDMDEKKRQLESVVDNVGLPEEVEEPTIMAISMNMMPVVALAVSSSQEDIVELTETVETLVLPEIEKIDGVASATVSGQHVNEVQFTYNKEKMEELGLTEDNVKQMINAQDMSLSLGLYEFKDGEQAVSIDGKLTTVDELKDLIIPTKTGVTTLGEIATIETVGNVQSISRTNGEDAIAIQIVKGQEANTVEVVNAVKALMTDLEKDIDGLIVDITLDQGEPIEESVFTMVEKALFGGGIAILIILLFLRDFKSTIISIISIPVSVFMAFLLLNWLDITLNIMTLGAITVAIGRVIDDSIVVVENIYRRLHLENEKLTGRALIREATIEMFKPILSSTLVTIAVFAPLIFVGGMVGELFMPFALTMSFALISSLLVAITIVPALSHTLFRKKLYGEKKEGHHKEVGKLALWYRGVLDKALNHKIVTSLIAVVLLAGALALTPLIGFSFMGSSVEKVMYITYTPAAGELPDATEESIEDAEKLLLEDYQKEIDIVQLSITDSASADAATMMMGSSGALMYVIFNDDVSDKRFLEAKDEILEELAALDHEGEWKNQDFTMGMGSNEVSYTLYSEDLEDLQAAVHMYAKTLEEVDTLGEVSSDAEDPYVEHVLKVDQANVIQYGLTTGQIVMALTDTGKKEVLTTVEHDGQEIEVIVQRNVKAAAESIDDVLNTPIQTMTGQTLTIGDIVEVEEGTTLNSLARSEGKYYASVSAEILEDDISKATAEADEKVKELDIPKGVTAGVDGVAADMQETFTKLGVAMLAAIAIVYFILVVTFGEGLAPFAILFSLPFTVIGSWVGLWLTDQTISVSVMMGLLMLIGIVVTNAIVLVDRIIRMERAGMPMREAILEAGATRLRPILMTAIATIGAMIPMALGTGGGGGLISRDLAVTVIGGLLSSTLLTLVVVPIVYEILSKLFKKNRLDLEEN